MARPSSKHPNFLTARERQDAIQASGARKVPRFLVIGAGQRGIRYATEIVEGRMNAIIAAVAEPVESRRKAFCRKFIWSASQPSEDQEFDGWQDFLQYETQRRELETAGERTFQGVDGVFICTLDHTHKEIVEALAPLKLHIMCEKPLAQNLQDCKAIFRSLNSDNSGPPEMLISVGHVLRYSPFNMMLRKLLLEEKVIGEIISIEHTEPVGWWHYAHSYVRGNWRNEAYSGPSLLCKSCHDIDFLLWLLAYRTGSGLPTHMPTFVSSMGNLSYFTRRRKPAAAGGATNCLACPIEADCNYSAKKIYLGEYDKGIAGWPNDVLVPDLEDIVQQQGIDHGRELLLKNLSQDYDKHTPQKKIESKTWYGRCVWESDNNVCDDQVVTLQWLEDSLDKDGKYTYDRGPKTALFHMTANTQKQCERRGRISGTNGEIAYDSSIIEVTDFTTRSTRSYEPRQAGGGHGGGDDGLAGQFLRAVGEVINGGKTVNEAQAEYIGCTLEEAFMSHAMVFAAEEARKQRRVIDWPEWWKKLLQTS